MGFAMTVHCVILSHGDGQEVRAFESNLKFSFPDMYKLAASAYLISSPKTSTEVAIELGVRPEEATHDWSSKYRGVVFSLNGSYSGFHQPDLWSWLARHGAAW